MFDNKLSKFVGVLIVAAVTSGGAAQALTLHARTGATQITVVDNSMDDADPRAGVVRYTGSVGGYDITDFTASTSFANNPAGGTPKLTVNSFAVNSLVANPDELSLQVWEDSYVLTKPFGLHPSITDTELKATTTYGGVTNGYVDLVTNLHGAGHPQNEDWLSVFVYDFAVLTFEAGIGCETAPCPPTLPGASTPFSGEDSRLFTVNYGETFALGVSIGLDHDEIGDVTSMSATTTTVPVPLPIVLLGTALAGIGYFGRNKTA